MKLTESSKYKRSYKKLVNKHLNKELGIIDIIKNQIYLSKSMDDFMRSSIKYKFNIEQKKGDLKEFFTARLNGHTRLIMRPCGDYPYNLIEIVEIEFIDINEKHYKE
jgi:plasmid maintenance system killer protein